MKPPILKVALWTSSVGIAVLIARRLLGRRANSIDVGPVSDDWLAQQRGAREDPFAL
jgi:hypothetical protein